MEDSDLDTFLTSWKDEIRTGEKPQSLGKREPISTDQGSPVKRSLISASSESSSTVAPLLVLPSPNLAPRPEATGQSAAYDGGGTAPELKCQRLLDVLISDLNEINSIPFFEVQLPREIAVVIFGFLDVRDLCQCAMVSRSWNHLAEDNLLWYKIYQTMQHKPSELHADSLVRWKTVVQDTLLEARQVERNWKERICGLSDYQPDDCRVLCCISYHQGKVLPCYSSGTVCMWDLSSEEGPRRVKQIPGPYLTSEPACCDLATSWAVVGTADGCLKILDVDTCSQVYSLSDLGSVHSVSISHDEGHLAVGVASHHAEHPCVSVLLADQNNSWLRTRLPLGDTKSVTKVKVLPSPHSVLYSTPTSLTLHPVHSPLHPTHILDALGGQGQATMVSCFEVDMETTTVACGTSAFGYQVQLFDLPSGSCRSSLKGHGQLVTSLSLPPIPHMVASGSADKRVRVFDCRCHAPFPVLTLRGHSGCVKCVQMDQWKVISGSSDGTLVVWDQRMAGELWRTHERHSVNYCSFDSRYLVCSHIPFNKHPISSEGENPNICHRRLRGLVRVMDFSVDSLYYTKKLPSICSSNYDEPSASFFNLDLKFPYDAIS